MNIYNQVIVLGTGTSTGVPTIGCICPVCTSNDPKNHRLRASIYLRTKSGKEILIDTTPDLRTQFLNNKLSSVDACIITHEHADHTHGIDDLRPLGFFKSNSTKVYTYQKCADHLREKFPYIFKAKEVFKDKPILGGGIPRLELETVESAETIEGESFAFHLLPHGYTKTLSFIHEKFAYIIDANTVSKEWIEKCKKRELDLLIIDCVRRKPHQTHLHLDKALEIAQKIGAKMTGLSHMTCEFDYHQLSEELKNRCNFNVFPLFDGQILDYGSC